MKYLVLFLVYICFGVAFHAVMLGPTIEPYSAWSVGWITGWPILILAVFFKWFVIWAVVILVCVGFYMLWDNQWFRMYRQQLRAIKAKGGKVV